MSVQQEEGVRNTPTSRKPIAPVTTQSSPQPEHQAGNMTRTQQVVLVIVGVLAVIGSCLGLFALTNLPSTAPLQRQINALKAVDASQHQQIANLQAQTATLKASAASAATAGNLAALQTSVGGLSKTVIGVQGNLTQLHTCLPELSQEVNGLSINTNSGSILLGDSTTDTFLTSAFINNSTIISTNCTKFLTGQ